MHLGEAEFGADLGLRPLRPETEFDDAPVPVVELRQKRLEGMEVLGESQRGVLVTDQVGDQPAALPAAAGVDRAVQGIGVVAVAGDKPLDDFVLAQAQMRGEVGHARLVIARGCQLFAGAGHVDA